MPVTVGGSPITPTQAEQLRVALGVDGDPVTTIKPTPVGADRIVLLDSAADFAPVLATLASLPGGGGAGVLVTVTHNGGGANPVTGDTLTAAFATGYTGSVQWQRNGTNIAGATNPTYMAVSADEGTTVRPQITSLIYTATGLPVGAPAATVPAAFTAGQWDAAATATAGEMQYQINALPSDGGSAGIRIEYTTDGGATFYTLSGGFATGNRTVTAGWAAGVADDTQVRAVNAIGPGAWSDIKNRTPAAAAGVTFVAAGATYTEYGSLTSHVVGVPAGLAVGHMLVLAGSELGGTPVSVVASNGQALTLAVQELGTIYSVVVAGTVPTSVTVTLSSAIEYRAKTVAFSGATQLAGTTNEDVIATPRTNIQYSTDVASAGVVVVYTRGGGESVTGATFNGSDPADALAKFDFDNQGIIFGVHDGGTGLRDIALTWSATDSGGRYITAAFKP